MIATQMLRYVKRTVEISPSVTRTEVKLQQMWEADSSIIGEEEGGIEWRDIPIVDEKDAR